MLSGRYLVLSVWYPDDTIITCYLGVIWMLSGVIWCYLDGIGPDTIQITADNIKITFK